MTTSSEMNPDALLGAAEPTVEWIEIEEARIYAEVRGSGDPVLLIGAADEGPDKATVPTGRRIQPGTLMMPPP